MKFKNLPNGAAFIGKHDNETIDSYVHIKISEFDRRKGRANALRLLTASGGSGTFHRIDPEMEVEEVLIPRILMHKSLPDGQPVRPTGETNAVQGLAVNAKGEFVSLVLQLK